MEDCLEVEGPSVLLARENKCQTVSQLQVFCVRNQEEGDCSPRTRFHAGPITCPRVTQYRSQSEQIVAVPEANTHLVVSHVRVSNGCQPEETTLHGGQSRSMLVVCSTGEREQKYKFWHLTPSPLPPDRYTLLLERAKNTKYKHIFFL